MSSRSRADGEAAERTDFLKGRRDELGRRAGALAAAITVLNNKIAYCGVR